MDEFGSFPKTPTIKTDLPGPVSKELLAQQSVFETASRMYTSYFPIAVREGKNASIMDVDGNTFIDWFAGVCVIALGHGNPKVIGAIKEQLNSISHINELPTLARVDFLKTLQSTLPGNLRTQSKIMFSVTGGDACEAAISLARHVSRKRTVIAFGGAYHGTHGGIVGMTASYHYRENNYFGGRDVVHLPYPYSYRFPVKVKEGDESKVIVDMLKYVTDDPYSGVDPVGAVIVEPIQGEGGYIVPPDDFLPLIREFTAERNIPLIIDEVQTGVGRTGRIWASEWTNIDPDIMCVSKAIGGGIPLSLIAYRKEYDENLPPGFHLGTYRGNPLAIAAGAAILKELKEGGILLKVRKQGEQMLAGFQEMSSKSPLIGEVRGRGFMIGIELVRNGKEPATEEAKKLRNVLFKNGVLMHTCGHYSNVMRFMAPLTIEKDLIERGMDIFNKAILVK